MAVVSDRGNLISFRAVSLGVLDSTLEAKLIVIGEGVKEVKRMGASVVGIFSDYVEMTKVVNDKENLRCRGGYTLVTLRNELH